MVLKNSEHTWYCGSNSCGSSLNPFKLKKTVAWISIGFNADPDLEF